LPGDWSTTPTINSGATATLLMQFSDPLVSPNAITIFFNVGCNIAASN
jgi:hypothetical protein